MRSQIFCRSLSEEKRGLLTLKSDWRQKKGGPKYQHINCLNLSKDVVSLFSNFQNVVFELRKRCSVIISDIKTEINGHTIEKNGSTAAPTRAGSMFFFSIFRSFGVNLKIFNQISSKRNSTFYRDARA